MISRRALLWPNRRLGVSPLAVRAVAFIAGAMIFAAACAGSVADEGVTETIAPRATSTPFPTLVAAPPPTVVPDSATEMAEPTGADDASAGTIAEGAVAAAAEAAAAADPDAVTADTSDIDGEVDGEVDAEARAAFTMASKVTTVGLDEVYFGMTARAAGEAADTEWTRSSTSTSCTFITPIGGPTGVRFWVWNGSVERVDVSNPGITTPSGFGVGTEVSILQERLGASLEIGEASTGGRRAVFVPTDESDAEFRIIFEIGDDDTVTRYRSGRLGVVELDASACT